MNFIVLEYRSLVYTQPEFNRLKDFVGQELNDQRRIDLYRHQPGKKPFLLRMIDRLINYQQRGYHSDGIMQQLEALKGANQPGHIEAETDVLRKIDTNRGLL